MQIQVSYLLSEQPICERAYGTEENSLDYRIFIETGSALIPGTASFYCALNIYAVACSRIDAVLASEDVSNSSNARIDNSCKSIVADSP